MEAIIICGMPASGKSHLARILSGKLALPLIAGGDILKEMAVIRGYKPGGEDWWDTPEGMKFLKEREANSEFDREADKLLVEKIEKGNIIVTSWTAPWLTKHGFKIWLTASPKTRSERMSVRDETSPAHSAKVVSERDTKNQKLYMDLYKIDMGNDLSPFDLIIDTDNRTPEQVADIVLSKIKR